MSKHERSSRREYYDADRYERHERPERESRREKDKDTRRRRHRSPSYDSYEESSSDSEPSREPSPRRPSRRHTTAYSDGEDRGHRGRDRQRRHRDYHSDYSRSPSPERRGIVEDLLAAVGLIQSKNKDRSRGDRSYREGSQERSKNTKQALQAALTAAAMEAFRTRKEGKLTPQRLLQIAGAAVAAGGLDALIDRSGSNGGSLRSLVESVVGGLATSKTMGGKIKQKRSGSVDNKVKTGMVGMAARQLLGRSLSRGPSRRRTDKW